MRFIIILLTSIFFFMLTDSSRADQEALREHQPKVDDSVSNRNYDVSSVELFPAGELFHPPLASQKEPRSHATWLHMKIEGDYVNVGSVGFGESFGFLRLKDNLGNSWQWGLSGAIFAQFNLDSNSADLINADYIIGLPFSYRRGPWSMRIRPYHQSSHLGDEYLLNPQKYRPDHRIDVSYETVELLGAWEWNQLRFSGGASYIMRTSTPLDRWSLQGAVDYESKTFWSGTSNIFSSVLLHSWEETNWNADLSIRSGLNIRNPSSEKHAIQVYAEYNYGNLPFGQFFTLRGDFYGMGIRFCF